ncbi:MAG: zinc ribbon domain-containing protein [Planctomycetes bacterium]|nr:zinc ribbon domain-containing protein [Planctomycetota bacterium]
MPTYEYICRGCGFEFERFQSITASAVRTCPRCGARKVERRIGIGGAVIFKGGGFYETDYRSESYRKGEESERGAKDAEGKSESTAADSAKTPAPKGDAAKTSDAGGDSAAQGTAATGTKDTSGTKAANGSAKTKATPSSAQRGKNHAREGRGIGNVLQLGHKGPRREGRSSKGTGKQGKK